MVSMNDHRITNLDFTQNEPFPDQYSATQQPEALTNVTENDYGGDGTVTATASAVCLAGHPTSSASLRKTHQNASTQPRECLRRYQTSVWDAYRKHFDVKLNGPVEVAVCRADPSMLVIVRPAAATDISSRRKELTRLMRQPYFVQCWELYAADPVPHLVCEYMSISLVHVVGLPVFPSEAELAAIAGQLTNALAFLERHRMCHQKLTTSRVLLNSEGSVKIAEPELCYVPRNPPSENHNVHELGDIISHLATKSTGKICQLPPERYTPEVMNFISATVNMTAVELCEDTLLAHGWQPSDLKPMVELSHVASRRFWGLPPTTAENPPA